MEFKKLILILAITATIVFGCLWGSTYAYYTYSGGTSLNVTTGNVNTGVVVVFNQSEYMLRQGFLLLKMMLMLMQVKQFLL